MGIRERKVREKKQRREVIINAAKTMFLQKGIEHTTMLDIARKAELSKAALYLYFRSKEELTFEMLYISFTKINDLIQEAGSRGSKGYDKLKHISEEFRKFYKKQPEYIYFTFVLERYADSISAGDPATEKCMLLIEHIKERIITLLRLGIDDGSIRQDLDAEKIAALFLHMVPIFMQRITTMHQILGKNSTYKPDELIEEMFTVFLNSLK